MSPKRKVLILNGTTSEIPIIQAAKSMGCYVFTTGNMPELPGHREADEYICADYSDVNAIFSLVKSHDIEGIISCANDFGSITASYVAERMGWPGHDTYENALLLHQKDRFMQYFKSNGIPVPRFEIISEEGAAKKILSTWQDYPLMVKTTDLTGGKGIAKVESADEAEKAVHRAFSLSRNKRILIEPFLKGPQKSIVVFLVQKKIKALSHSDIFMWRNPFLVQAETYPARDFDTSGLSLCKIIEDMAEDLKLCDGILSFQYIVQDNVPYIIDIMRRSFGNGALLMADERTGFPWEKAYVMASLGMDCSGIEAVQPTSKYCGHYGVMAQKNGIFSSFSLPDYFAAHVFKQIVNVRPGMYLENHLTEKIANIYFRYDDFEEMHHHILNCDKDVIVNMQNE